MTDTDAYCIPMQDLILVFSVLLLVWITWGTVAKIRQSFVTVHVA